MKAIDDDYQLIPMEDITDEAREIAVRWAEGNGYNSIGDKHKLASDIMNYARRQIERLQKNNKVYNKKCKCEDAENYNRLICPKC